MTYDDGDYQLIMLRYDYNDDHHYDDHDDHGIKICQQLGSDDGMSEYGDDRGSEDLSLWQVFLHIFS